MAGRLKRAAAKAEQRSMVMMIRRLLGVALLGVVVLGAVACGGKSDQEQAQDAMDKAEKTVSAAMGTGDTKALESLATQAAKSAGNVKGGGGSCEVKVGGDKTVSWSGKGSASSVSSDYWFSDSDFKTMFELLKTAGQSVDDMMKQDPKLFLVILNCSSADSKQNLTLMPSEGTKYKDVPFKSGEYDIAKGEGMLGMGGNAGQFTTLLTVGESFYTVAETGKLKITKFDKSGIAGTFSFKATEMSFGSGASTKVVPVEGKFEFTCVGGENCKP